MNYLIMEDFSGRPVPFIFPRRVDHADMRDQLPYGQALACGVVELGADGFHCQGGSAELGLRARPAEDAAIIAEALGCPLPTAADETPRDAGQDTSQGDCPGNSPDGRATA